MGSEEIAAGCQHHCKKEHARHLIQSTDLEKQNRGIHQLCLIAEQRDVPELLALLEQDLTKRTGIWAKIIPTLGRLKDTRAVPLLRDLVQLADEDWLGRVMAVRALGEIGDSRAVPVLIQAAWRAETRAAAIAALAQIDDPRAGQCLFQLFSRKKSWRPKRVRQRGLSVWDPMLLRL